MITIVTTLYSTYSYTVGSGNAAPTVLIFFTICVCLLNPVTAFIDFYVVIYGSGNGILSLLKDEIPNFSFILNDVVAIILSFALLLVIAYLITLIAATLINPIRGYKDKSEETVPQNGNMNMGTQPGINGNMNAGTQSGWHR